jgi:hypothetical protein
MIIYPELFTLSCFYFFCHDHLNRLSPSMGNRINDVLEAIQNNLDKNVEYNITYKIEKALD